MMITYQRSVGWMKKGWTEREREGGGAGFKAKSCATHIT